MGNDLGRRALLRCGAACALAACGKFVDEPVAIQVGAPSKGLLSVPTARMPELSRTGGSILLHSDARDFIGRTVSVLVANTSSQGLRAYGAYCPHSGCEVAWVDGENSVVCPCHLSRFAVDGSVTHPPAVEGLDAYPAKLSPDGQTLIVDLSGSDGVFPAAAGGAVTFTVQQLPALAQVGGSVTGHAAGVPFPLVVLRASASQMLAFDARCPHLGCAVRGAQQLFICPCHGSLFNLDGSVKLGPATAPLTALQVTFDGTQVVVKVPA
ncbi:MAG TPA: Rieske 2Fe-2S domain-containing protein [Myxococcales bacterium]